MLNAIGRFDPAYGPDLAARDKKHRQVGAANPSETTSLWQGGMPPGGPASRVRRGGRGRGHFAKESFT